MRDRVGAVNFLFINASNQLGQFESGVSATLLRMKLFPSLRKVERPE